MKQTDNWLTGIAQRILINGAGVSWGLLTSGIPQGSVLGLVLFYIFICDLDKRIESTLIKFADNTNLGGVYNTLEGCAAIHQDLNIMEFWEERNPTRFNNCKHRNPAPRDETLHALEQVMEQPAREELCREGPTGSGGQQAGNEPAVVPCGQES